MPAKLPIAAWMVEYVGTTLSQCSRGCYGLTPYRRLWRVAHAPFGERLEFRREEVKLTNQKTVEDAHGIHVVQRKDCRTCQSPQDP